jgi:molecular chaperone GrpE
MTENATDDDARDPQDAPESAGNGGAGNGGAESAAASDELEALRRKSEEHWNNYLRAVAELDNLRKRNAREIENARKYGAERLAQALLPVRDSIEAALASADKVDIATLLEGDRATLRLLDQALDGAGIREIDPHGDVFDPTKHEAMTLQPTAEAAPDTIVMVVQKGYELNDRLLRPARVIVASALPESGDSAG